MHVRSNEALGKTNIILWKTRCKDCFQSLVLDQKICLFMTQLFEQIVIEIKNYLFACYITSLSLYSSCLTATSSVETAAYDFGFCSIGLRFNRKYSFYLLFSAVTFKITQQTSISIGTPYENSILPIFAHLIFFIFVHIKVDNTA